MPKLTKTYSRPKALGRVKNWSEYNKVLVQPGLLTFWMSEGFEKAWLYVGVQPVESECKSKLSVIFSITTQKAMFWRFQGGRCPTLLRYPLCARCDSFATKVLQWARQNATLKLVDD